MNTAGIHKYASRQYANYQWYPWTYQPFNLCTNIYQLNSGPSINFKMYAYASTLVGTGGTSLKLFDTSDIESLLNTSGVNNSNTVICVMNGNANAYGGHLTSCYYNDAWYITSESTIPNGDRIQVNFIIVKFR